MYTLNPNPTAPRAGWFSCLFVIEERIRVEHSEKHESLSLITDRRRVRAEWIYFAK